MDPLPELCAADLGGGGVLHQVEERHAADAAQPRLDVAQADGDVLLQAGFGDGAGGDLQQVGGGGVVVRQLLRNLVGLRHHPVEDFERDRDQPGVSNPGAVVAVAGLAFFICLHTSDGALVCFWI